MIKKSFTLAICATCNSVRTAARSGTFNIESAERSRGIVAFSQRSADFLASCTYFTRVYIIVIYSGCPLFLRKISVAALQRLHGAVLKSVSEYATRRCAGAMETRRRETRQDARGSIASGRRFRE